MGLDKGAILEFVKRNGPILPVELARNLEVNILFASAILSELVDGGHLKLTYAKFGGTPLYYSTGQEPKLQILREKLPDALKKAYDLLREKKVLGDTSLPPAYRVALRELRDFAKSIEVDSEGQQLIYWKWYLSSNEEVRSALNAEQAFRLETEKPQIPVVQPAPEKSQAPAVQSAPEKPRVEPPKEKLPPGPLKERQLKKEGSSGEFEEKVLKFLRGKNISITKRDVVRKGKEIDFIAKMKTDLGELNVFIKAKDKKKIDDSDLALINSQYPIVLVTTGQLTKKAQEFLKSGKYVLVSQI